VGVLEEEEGMFRIGGRRVALDAVGKSEDMGEVGEGGDMGERGSGTFSGEGCVDFWEGIAGSWISGCGSEITFGWALTKGVLPSSAEH
jgi:hypothetical protein